MDILLFLGLGPTISSSSSPPTTSEEGDEFIKRSAFRFVDRWASLPAEQTGQLAILSPTAVLCLFTRNRDELQKSIMNATDTAAWNFTTPMKSLAGFCTQSSFPNCRRIVMMLSNTNEIEYPITKIAPFPSHLTIHILTIARNKFLAKDTTRLRQLALESTGSFTQMGIFDNGDADLLHLVDDLCTRLHDKYIGTIHIDTMRLNIKLTPDPDQSEWVFTQLGILPKLPRKLPILGVATKESVACPPQLAIFLITPVLTHGHPVSLPSSLTEYLGQSSRVALVDLGSSEWYGMLTTVPAGGPNTGGGGGKGGAQMRLVLSIYLGNMPTKSFGSTKELVAKLKNQRQAPKDEPEVVINFTRVPKRPTGLDMFGQAKLDPKIATMISEDQLLAHLEEVNRLKKKLPETRKQLYELCEKMRQVSLQFVVPNLMDRVIAALQQVKQGHKMKAQRQDQVNQLVDIIRSRKPIALSISPLMSIMSAAASVSKSTKDTHQSAPSAPPSPAPQAQPSLAPGQSIASPSPPGTPAGPSAAGAAEATPAKMSFSLLLDL